MIKHKVRTKETQQKQFGRIMMEMLGVLALVGLLTLGFIFYQKALLADRVNRLMEDARLAGLVVLDGVYTKLTVNEELSLKGQFEQQTPYNFSAYLEGEELKTFVVLVDSVPYDVCREIIDRHPQWAEEIIANKLQNQCLAEMDNIIGFFYNDELTNNMESCQKDSDCGECGTCEKRHCSYGFKNRSGKCKSCDDSAKSITGVDREECNKCSNRIWSSASGGRCLLCTDNYWSDVPYEECIKCPKFHTNISPGQTGVCWRCLGNIDSATGKCDTIDCNHSGELIYGVTAEACSQCSDRFYSEYYNVCRKCGTASNRPISYTSFEDCLKCPNQASSVSSGKEGYCSYCPGTVDPVTGKCDTIECNSSPTEIAGVSKDLCNQCENRFYSTLSGGRCIKCLTSTGAWNGVPFEECLKCPNQSSDVAPGQVGRCKYCAGTVNPTTGKCE